MNVWSISFQPRNGTGHIVKIKPYYISYNEAEIDCFHYNNYFTYFRFWIEREE